MRMTSCFSMAGTEFCDMLHKSETDHKQCDWKTDAMQAVIRLVARTATVVSDIGDGI